VAACGLPPTVHGHHSPMTYDEIKAGAEDAARHLNYQIVGAGQRNTSDEEPVYTFAFAASDGSEASVEFLAERATVARSGLTAREFARLEILDALGVR
jgi:hypothetical protein